MLWDGSGVVKYFAVQSAIGYQRSAIGCCFTDFVAGGQASTPTTPHPPRQPWYQPSRSEELFRGPRLHSCRSGNL